MTVASLRFNFKTKGDGDMLDVTQKVSELVRRSGITSGTVTVFVPGATGAVTTIEYEPGLIEDTDEMFERLAPRGIDYHHNRRWQDGNGHAHVRASVLGPSLTVPFTYVSLLLGTWQQIVFIDFDNRSRSRELICQVLGD